MAGSSTEVIQRPLLPESEYAMEEWKPGLAISVVWSILSLGLTVVAFVALLGIHHALPDSPGFMDSTLGGVERQQDGTTTYTVSFPGLLTMVVLVAVVLVLHEAIHGVMFRVFGGRPHYGAAIHNGFLPVLYCTAHGYLFSRGQFTAIVLAPAVVITVAGVVIMVSTGFGAWAIVPVALNLGGAVGDFWMTGLLTLKPAGTRIEDRKDGLRFYVPIDHRED